MQVILGPSPFHIVYAGTQGQNQGTIVNFDNSNIVLVGPDQGSLYAANPECFQIGPLNSVTVDGSRDYWGIALTGTAAVEFMPGVTNWEPSPAQAAIQISTLGLATESTLDQVNGHAFGIAINTQDTVTTLGSPAQDATVGQVNSTLGTPAQNGTVSGLGTTIPGNIATTGAPLLAFSNQWTNTGALSYAAGQTRQIGPGAFGQISFEALISLTNNVSATNPSFSVVFQWQDNSGNIVQEETWYMCGGASPGNTFIGSGRAKGARLQIFVTNDDTLGGFASVLIYQSSRVYVKDDWRSLVLNNVPGFTPPNRDPTANVLCTTAPTVAASSSVVRILPLYAGTVRISALTQTGGAQYIITAVDTSVLATSNEIWSGSISGANGFLNQQFDLPRYQCQLMSTNVAAGSQQLPVSIMISEQNI